MNQWTKGVCCVLLSSADVSYSTEVKVITGGTPNRTLTPKCDRTHKFHKFVCVFAIKRWIHSRINTHTLLDEGRSHMTDTTTHSHTHTCTLSVFLIGRNTLRQGRSLWLAACETRWLELWRFAGGDEAIRHWLELHLERNMKLDRKTKRTEVYRSDFLLEPEEWNLIRFLWIMFMRVILISAAFSSWHLVSSWHTSCQYLNSLVYIFVLIFWSLSIC